MARRRRLGFHFDQDQSCPALRSAIFVYVVRCTRFAPVPRLPRADEARQDDPASRRVAGNLRVLLLAVQAGGDQGAGGL